MWRNFGSSGCFSSYNNLFSSEIFKTFSLREIISDDFLETLYPIAIKYTRFSIISYFSAVINSSTFNPSEEESKYLFNKYFNIICSKINIDDIKYSLTTIIKTLEGISKTKDESEIIEFLFNENFFKNISCSKETVSEYVNKIISSSSIENMENFISMVREQVPDYAAFPLIILNPNVSQENKIKAVKLTYKQKDFPQYKRLFRDNITDFNDVDVFIKATILENNRVREKEDNLIKFFKDIFVSGDYYFRSNTLKNIKTFFENYKQYFTNKDFIHKLYIQSVEAMQKMQYERKRQYEKFIAMLFSTVDDLSLINYVAEIPELRSLGDSFSNRFLDCFISKKYDLCKEYLKVFAAWSKEERNFLFTNFKDTCYSDLLTIFADDESLHKCLNELKIVSDKISKDGYQSYALYEPATYYFNQNSKLVFLDTLNACNKKPQLLQYFNAINPGDENYFGLKYENIYTNKLSKLNYRSTGQLYSIVTCIRDFYNYLETVTVNSDNQEFLQAVYEKYIQIFEDENNAQELTTNIMSFNSNEQTKYYEAYSNSNGNKPLITTEFLSLIDNICNIAEKVYTVLNKSEAYETFKSNITDCKETLSIVCSM